MISKCIRRLSFRSLADDKYSLDAINNNSSKSEQTKNSPACLPAPVAVKPSSWTTALWDKMAVSPVEQRGGINELDLTVPMMCKVFLQQCGDAYIISVVLHRSDSDVKTQHGDIVASSAVPTNIQPGALAFEIQSPFLEGETVRLVEGSWRGADLEKQFVLSLKSCCKASSLLGKVIITHKEQCSTLFELNMLKSCGAKPTLGADLAWGAAGFRELAALLHLVDENEDFGRLARDLGFTEHELKSKLLPSPEPFCALLQTYQARGGTPEELVRAMYSCSRVRGLGIVGGSLSPMSSMLSQTSSFSSVGRLLTPVDPELDDLEEAGKLMVAQFASRKRKCSEATTATSSKRSRKSSQDTTPEDWDLEFCDAATLPVGDIELGIPQSALPPTPPATPLKRLTGGSFSNH